MTDQEIAERARQICPSNGWGGSSPRRRMKCSLDGCLDCKGSAIVQLSIESLRAKLREIVAAGKNPSPDTGAHHG